MTCDRVTLPGGQAAIVCHKQPRQRCACGRLATLLCDWKVSAQRGTCDKPLCDRCSTSPMPGKDLCPSHAVAYEAWKAQRA